MSFARRGSKRMTLSGLARQPARIVRPSTKRAFAKIEPMIEVCATMIWPWESEKMTTKNSGRLPSVDWRTPVAAGPKRSPTCSVENETTQASPARASVAITAKVSRARVACP